MSALARAANARNCMCIELSSGSSVSLLRASFTPGVVTGLALCKPSALTMYSACLGPGSYSMPASFQRRTLFNMMISLSSQESGPSMPLNLQEAYKRFRGRQFVLPSLH